MGEEEKEGGGERGGDGKIGGGETEGYVCGGELTGID